VLQIALPDGGMKQKHCFEKFRKIETNSFETKIRFMQSASAIGIFLPPKKHFYKKITNKNNDTKNLKIVLNDTDDMFEFDFF
jgi:hypothetical protein